MDAAASDNTNSRNMVTIKCPVCKHGRICDVHRNRAASFQNRLTDKTGYDGIRIKCPCCKNNVTIKI
jgi:hypothetical protein